MFAILPFFSFLVLNVFIYDVLLRNRFRGKMQKMERSRVEWSGVEWSEVKEVGGVE